MKVFNCLTIYPLNRKNQLEKNIDDIIMNIGLLRTSLILFKIKFQSETPKNENSNSNTNSSNAELEDEDIEIVIDGEDKNITKGKEIYLKQKRIEVQPQKLDILNQILIMIYVFICIKIRMEEYINIIKIIFVMEIIKLLIIVLIEDVMERLIMILKL